MLDSHVKGVVNNKHANYRILSYDELETGKKYKGFPLGDEMHMKEFVDNGEDINWLKSRIYEYNDIRKPRRLVDSNIEQSIYTIFNRTTMSTSDYFYVKC